MAEPLGRNDRHTLADHLSGEDAGHSHGEGEYDHDHDHDHDDLGLYDPSTDPLKLQDQLTLLSVGIDIGSSGSQVIFSRVALRRRAEDLTSRYSVVDRERLYQSPVALTPYQSEERIDESAVGAIVDAAYAGAGIHPDQIDTGAVILTGEALRRENAQAIADVLAEIAGEFVCATAGPHMESLLAAYGSGAAKASHDLGRPVLNVDIGGGTTKLALVEGGRVVHSAALQIGGRLAVVEDGRLTRLDPAGRQLARNAGLDWAVGVPVREGDLERVTEWMADALIAALTESPFPSSVDRLWLTEPLEPVGGIAGVMFSGGVAEYVYGREERDFGDLGRRLGAAIRRRLERGALPHPLLPAGECIRATAMGASEYSVQLSGNTVYISSPGSLLPRKNLQVLQPDVSLGETIDPVRVAQAIRRHFEAFDLTEGEAEVALAFRWQGAPSYDRLSSFARGILDAVPRTIAGGRPLYLVLDGDVAHSLGALMKEEWRVAPELLVIDGIALWDFDYVDLGRVRMPSHTVPVTIKSLVFSADPRTPRSRAPLHDHDPGGAHGHGHHHHPRRSHSHEEFP
jgi:ethanolamine utilization protein EutA